MFTVPQAPMSLFSSGASLAQDRGKLEAKIEVLTSETETLKKQNESLNDALQIKSKIVEDQTETIRKLKEVRVLFFFITIINSLD